MSSQERFNVYLTGRALDGFELINAKESFTERFKLTTEKVQQIFQSSMPYCIKKDVDAKTAQVFKEAVLSVGLDAHIEPVPAAKIDFRSLSLAPHDGEVESSEADVTTSQFSSVAPHKPITFQCPKCGTEQEKSIECINCGIFFEKYESAQQSIDNKNTHANSQLNHTSSNDYNQHESDEQTGISFGNVIGFMIFGLLYLAVLSRYFNLPFLPDITELGGESAFSMGIEEPGSYVKGKTIAEWTGDWWNWANSFDYDDNPITDTSGVNCANGQKGDVWFLAGSYDSEPVNRDCTIPSGKYLLIPMVNNYSYEDISQVGSCDALNREAAFSSRQVSVELDGNLLKEAKSHYEKTTDCFTLKMDGEKYTAASAGYWVMIAPLEAGEHSLRVQSKDHSFKQDITYKLTIKE